MVAEQFSEIQNKVMEACKKADRDPSSVTLIAVSKTKPLEDLKEAYLAGARHFGENKVQELQDKIPNMPSDVHWHMIGHLQTNKVKYLVGRVDLIHSVDSVKLAETIEKESAKAGVVSDILLEINVAEEESKFGITCDNALEIVKAISKLTHVHICGLMTVAPYVADAEENRPVFHKLKQLSVDISRENIDNVAMDVLSMGMTNDFEVAISEGATLVRVGTAIFGERNYAI